ncbi:hypothetical protein UO65_3443 [Actinokineospora spheciospongiae]|uniref:Uncharacterized protein n=1 Tax=Actinokineospora spheciospongiae TaxID=909613 RepID=W7IXQ8_9PSEU|nr:hypothetical protein [Actinokineospora spheciospongiae]EWC61256.1 hypothetical protein UO65_3443 [Actinokineospora spheciospongiae]
MDQSTGWTGETACTLQAALRLTNEAFAEHLGVAVRTVAAWHQRPAMKPKLDIQQALDTALRQAPEDARARFTTLTRPTPVAPAPLAPEIAQRLTGDHHIGAALDWLDWHARWDLGTARAQVADRVTHLNVRDIRERGIRRARVTQRDIADALTAYYGTATRYSARYGDNTAHTSILTTPDWLDLNVALTGPADNITIGSGLPDDGPTLTATAADAAVTRIAETLALGTRITDNPLYRLTNADITPGRINGTFGVAPFMEYALTLDLLEGELVDALAEGRPTTPGALPLRDAHLPTSEAVHDLPNRLCAGGVLALTAIARPADHRGPADYLLLIQERSGHVINAARRLAVIPKGFHQPLTDLRGDAQLGATLLRETEEELFGRGDIDGTLGDIRTADPMHPSRLSTPLAWLLAEPDRLRMECLGFGLNLVSGNYEFPSLLVIEDEQFWADHGGSIEANWESANLRRYSTHDPDLITELLNEVAWSNEGLFAMLQALRRLNTIGGNRVNLPHIEWEISK